MIADHDHRDRRVRTSAARVILFLAVLCPVPAAAQELEPRAYSASPIGTNFLVVGVSRSSGDVVFDPTVPITDVRSDINAATLGVGRTFNLGGHLALATVAPIGRWFLDLSGGVWLFTSNDQFYRGDSTRAQDALFVLQTHASDNVTRRAWAAVDATWYGGADVSVDAGPPASRQNFRNSAQCCPLPKAHSRTRSIT